MFRRLAGLLLVAFAPAAMACEAMTNGWGLEGRSAEIEISNAKPDGTQHEGWASAATRLIMHAGFRDLTSDYGHDVLGGIKEARQLTIHLRQPGDDRITCPAEVILPKGTYFEDVTPRLSDLTGDGMPEIVVVESSEDTGARLSIYDRRGALVAATRPIGRRYRWLAPAGIADFNNDGMPDIAYVDRPHLAKILRIVTLDGKELVEIANLRGVSNHRIGDRMIHGGLYDCGGQVGLILASGNWQQAIKVTLLERGAVQENLGAITAPDDLARHLGC
ncbi:FG-GAP repeat domain-containing protein [Algicella marina]|uniref:VCBS repeat-containing protein n=1 Tax=Algicella marina TaxID=2683284 RepID=A0A6P1T0N2_9RHOB|nr:VCBS repeat-containing protein [Algicella marina]QHQ34996.1 VCBS repeat-containing protein [Algicella marina]